MTNTKLDALITDEDQIVDGLLLGRLDPVLGLSRVSDKIVPKAPFLQLTYRHKALACLLARHAMVRLQIPGATLDADANKVAEQGLIPLPRCREALSRLKGDGILESDGGGYRVPSTKVLVALEELAKASGGQN